MHQKSNDIEFQNTLDEFLNKAYSFIKDNSYEWNLKDNVNLEVVDHVIRVRVQDLTVQKYEKDVIDLYQCQNPDGGWGNLRDDNESKVRSTALTTQMLIRSNRILKNKKIIDYIDKGLEFILKKQNEENGWTDPTWHKYDATSVSVGTLLFAIKEEFWSKERYKNSLKRGIDYVLNQRSNDTMWYFKKSGSPVTITAHLLPKCVTYRGVMQEDFNTVRNLIKLQHNEGHWDKKNVDHTCDAIRAMMLTAGKAANKELYQEVYESVKKALKWLLLVSKDIGGLGDFPGEKAHVEATCDGIDAVLKFKQFIKSPSNMINFWS